MAFARAPPRRQQHSCSQRPLSMVSSSSGGLKAPQTTKSGIPKANSFADTLPGLAKAAPAPAASKGTPAGKSMRSASATAGSKGFARSSSPSMTPGKTPRAVSSSSMKHSCSRVDNTLRKSAVYDAPVAATIVITEASQDGLNGDSMYPLPELPRAQTTHTDSIHLSALDPSIVEAVADSVLAQALAHDGDEDGTTPVAESDHVTEIIDQTVSQMLGKLRADVGQCVRDTWSDLLCSLGRHEDLVGVSPGVETDVDSDEAGYALWRHLDSKFETIRTRLTEELRGYFAAELADATEAAANGVQAVVLPKLEERLADLTASMKDRLTVQWLSRADVAKQEVLDSLNQRMAPLQAGIEAVRSGLTEASQRLGASTEASEAAMDLNKALATKLDVETARLDRRVDETDSRAVQLVSAQEEALRAVILNFETQIGVIKQNFRTHLESAASEVKELAHAIDELRSRALQAEKADNVQTLVNDMISRIEEVKLLHKRDLEAAESRWYTALDAMKNETDKAARVSNAMDGHVTIRRVDSLEDRMNANDHLSKHLLVHVRELVDEAAKKLKSETEARMASLGTSLDALIQSTAALTERQDAHQSVMIKLREFIEKDRSEMRNKLAELENSITLNIRTKLQADISAIANKVEQAVRCGRESAASITSALPPLDPALGKLENQLEALVASVVERRTQDVSQSVENLQARMDKLQVLGAKPIMPEAVKEPIEAARLQDLQSSVNQLGEEVRRLQEENQRMSQRQVEEQERKYEALSAFYREKMAGLAAKYQESLDLMASRFGMMPPSIESQASLGQIGVDPIEPMFESPISRWSEASPSTTDLPAHAMKIEQTTVTRPIVPSSTLSATHLPAVPVGGFKQEQLQPFQIPGAVKDRSPELRTKGLRGIFGLKK